MIVRTATPSDARSMARVYVETWQVTYRGILPNAYLNAMTIEDSELSLGKEMAHPGIVSLVAESQTDGIMGFVTGGIRRQRDCIYEGEIFTLYVLSGFQRRGIGFRLVTGLVERLNRLEVYSVMVQVLKENPCRRFYEKINGVLLGSNRIRFKDLVLVASNYGWIDTDLILLPDGD